MVETLEMLGNRAVLVCERCAESLRIELAGPTWAPRKTSPIGLFRDSLPQ